MPCLTRVMEGGIADGVDVGGGAVLRWWSPARDDLTDGVIATAAVMVQHDKGSAVAPVDGAELLEGPIARWKNLSLVLGPREADIARVAVA